MKILYINTLYAPLLVGGAERVMQAQAEALRQAGHEVAVLTLCSAPGLHRDAVNGIPVWRAGLRNIYFPFEEGAENSSGAIRHNLWHLIDIYNPLMAAYVRRVVKEFQPDIASVHNITGFSVAVWDALAASGVPIVQVLHDQYLLCATSMMYRNGQRCQSQCAPCRITRQLHRYKSAKVDTLIGCSQFICDKVQRYGYFQQTKIVRAIPNIRDISKENLPCAPRNQDGETIFGFIGRLSPAKGIEFLLETLSRFEGGRWQLAIAGEGEPQYVAALKQKYASPRFRFLGRVKPGEFFANIDISVIPSMWEDTLPSVVFESLLYGKPVIGSRIGGIPEMLNAENGMLFEPGDQGSLSSAIKWGLANRGRLGLESEAIHNGALRFADKERWIREWTEVYGKTLLLR